MMKCSREWLWQWQLIAVYYLRPRNRLHLEATLMPSEQWYYRLDGRPHGPFSPVQFEKLIRGKTITTATSISQDGKTWQSLSDYLAGVPADNCDNSSSSLSMDAATLIPGQIRPPICSEAEQKNAE